MVEYVKVWDNDTKSYRTYEMRDSNSLRVVEPCSYNKVEWYVRPFKPAKKKCIFPCSCKPTRLFSEHVVDTIEYDHEAYYNYRTGRSYDVVKNAKRTVRHNINW